MTTTTTMQDVRKIVTHFNCADGTASAIVALAGFQSRGQDIEEVKFLAYNTPDHDNLIAEPGMLFVDLSPPLARIKEFADQGAYLLDHHRSVKDYVPLFGDRAVFADEKDDPGVSGAVLAYNHIYKSSNPDDFSLKNFADLVGIQDTWQKNDPKFEAAREMAQTLRFVPTSLLIKDGKLIRGVRDIFKLVEDMTPVVMANHWDRVTHCIDSAYHTKTPAGTKLGIINSTTLTSDAVGRMDVDVCVGFSYHGSTGKLGISLRSRGGYDVGALAASLGGGGHRAAAGCSLSVYHDRSPYQQIREMFTVWEHHQQASAGASSKP